MLNCTHQSVSPGMSTLSPKMTLSSNMTTLWTIWSRIPMVTLCRSSWWTWGDLMNLLSSNREATANHSSKSSTAAAALRPWKVPSIPPRFPWRTARATMNVQLSSRWRGDLLVWRGVGRSVPLKFINRELLNLCRWPSEPHHQLNAACGQGWDIGPPCHTQCVTYHCLRGS